MSVNTEEAGTPKDSTAPKTSGSSSEAPQKRLSFLERLKQNLQRDWIEQHGFNPHARDIRLGNFDKIERSRKKTEEVMERYGLNKKPADKQNPKSPADEQQEETEYLLDLGQTLQRQVKKNNGQFTESIKIKPSGDLDMTGSSGELKSYFANVAFSDTDAKGAEALYRLARKVQTLFPKMQFNFEVDKEGNWIKYTVT